MAREKSSPAASQAGRAAQIGKIHSLTRTPESNSGEETIRQLNSELKRKFAELDRANSDLQNLLSSTQIATIFLDGELRIKSFTPAAAGMFRLIDSDSGRPITDLAARFNAAHLERDIQEVLRTLAACQRQLAGEGGLHYQMRILPYRTVRNLVDGVVITFTDVTDLKRAQLYADSIVQTVREPLLVLDAEMRVQVANRSFYEKFGVAAGETEGCVLYELGNGQWDIPELRKTLTELLPQKNVLEGFLVEHNFPRIGPKTMLLNARQVRREKGEPELILLAIEDVTERHRDTEALTRFNRAAVGREMRMIELKREMNELCRRHGEPERFPAATEPEA